MSAQTAEERAMEYIKREFEFEPDPDYPDSLGNDPQTVSAYYAFIEGYNAAKQEAQVIAG